MHKALGVFVTGLSFATLCAAAGAQQLPKTGSINWHTGWKLTAEALPVADKTMQGHGMVGGVTFNDKGTGPLHLGPANCFFTFFVIDGKGTNQGYCAFGDADGDRIFTEFTGKVGLSNGYDEGTNVIAGGTGKYAGITGNGPWKCKAAGTNGESQCAQRLDYRLP
jgi:hypothetical protein